MGDRMEKYLGSEMATTAEPRDKRRELLTFLFLAVVIAPVLSIAIVGGYGFLVWIYQIFAGPPGPPAG